MVCRGRFVFFPLQLDQFVVIDMMLAFTLDGLANSHPIRVPVNHPDEINEIFDSISYNKVSWLLFESLACLAGKIVSASIVLAEADYEAVRKMGR